MTGPQLAHLAGRAVGAGACRLLPKSDLRGLVAAVHAEHAATSGPPPVDARCP